MWQGEGIRKKRGTAIGGTQTGVLLFYNIDTGLATVGQVDSDGNYADSGVRPPQQELGIALFPLGNGFVAFDEHPQDPEGPRSFSGRTDPAGRRVWRPEGMAESGQPHAVVHVRDSIVLIHRPAREVTIWTVEETYRFFGMGSPVLMNGPTWHVPAHDQFVMFYNAVSRKAATIRVLSDGGCQDLQKLQGFDY